MKILIATDTYPPHINGAAYFTQRLAHALKRNGHSILVIAPSLSLHTQRYQEGNVSIVGIRSIPLHVNNTRAALARTATRYIDQVIQQYAPDIVHTQGHFSLSKTVTSSAHKHGIPVVGTNHFMPDNLTHYVNLKGPLEKIVNHFMWRQCRDFFQSLEAVTTPTKTAADLCITNGFTSAPLVISNGINLDIFKLDHDLHSVQAKYHLPHKPTALFVGRLDKEKHIDEFIRAAALARQHVDMHIVITGSASGSHAHYLKKLAENLGIAEQTTFTGFVPDEDMPALYQSANVFVIPSIAELQSIATLEAMACGLPVIAADAIALPELIDSGKNGFLFQPGDIKSLSRHLIYILSDLDRAKQMGQVSRERATTHSLPHVINEFERLYQTVINRTQAA